VPKANQGWVDAEFQFVRLPDETLGVYNLWDTEATARLAHCLHRELVQTGQLSWFQEGPQAVQPAVLAMQRRGLLLDQSAHDTSRARLHDELHETDRSLRAHTPPGISFDSPTQLSKWLFNPPTEGGLGLKPAKITDKGHRQVDLESLVRVLQGLRKRDAAARPILEQLFHRSRLKTLLERYFDPMVGHDGRVRATVKMFGTKTFRFSYARPALQQFPDKLRRMFIASPGHHFVSSDYSQLEARIMAVLAQDRVSLDAFTRGEDIHDLNSRDLFGWSPSDWEALNPTQRKAARNFAKTFLYGLQYGGRAETMKMKVFCPCPLCVEENPPTLDLKRSEIALAERRWMARHPAVPRYQRQVSEQVRSTRSYLHPLGVRRYFAKPWGNELEREVKNVPMQMGAAILMVQAQVKLHQLGVPVCLQHHDSFLCEVPDEQIAETSTTLREVMEAPVPQMGGVRFPVTISVGRNWADRTIDNPEGLGAST